MPRLSGRVHEERAEARLQVSQAVRALDAAQAELDDAIALGVDAGLSWRELESLTGIHRVALSKKWGSRRT